VAKSDAERGDRAAWIVRHRKRLFGTNLGAFAAALKGQGVPAEVPTIRGWEAGANPRPEARFAMETLFGEPMPAPRQVVSLDELAGLLVDQTRAINALVTEIRLSRAEQQGRDDAIAGSLGELSGTLERFGLAPIGEPQPNHQP
jgi:hypothetical protein